MESSFLIEVDNTSILRTGLSSATTILSTGYRPLGSCSRSAGWSAATSCFGPYQPSPTVVCMAAVNGGPEVADERPNQNCPRADWGQSPSQVAAARSVRALLLSRFILQLLSLGSAWLLHG